MNFKPNENYVLNGKFSGNLKKKLNKKIANEMLYF